MAPAASPSEPYPKVSLSKPVGPTKTQGSFIPDDRFRAEDFVRGRWEVELLDWRAHCGPNGWMACCLPCVSIAQISVRVGVDSYGAVLRKQLVYNAAMAMFAILELVFACQYLRSVVGDHDSGFRPWASLMLVVGFGCFAMSLSLAWVTSITPLRARVRERFQIDGSTADDRYAMTWCSSCAIAQMATHVKSYTPGSCDFNAPDALPAYIP